MLPLPFRRDILTQVTLSARFVSMVMSSRLERLGRLVLCGARFVCEPPHRFSPKNPMASWSESGSGSFSSAQSRCV